MEEEKIRERYTEFTEATEAFYSGRMSVKEFKGISGGFGSYAQRGGQVGVARLRLSGGRITKDKLSFICDCIERYKPDMVHLTTCQSVQLHGLDGNVIPGLLDEAMKHDVFSYGGGGDYPRNVTATPLSGVIDTPFDVQPYAEAAGRFLINTVFGKKLPRKLKVGFSNTKENGTNATARDMGFIAKDNGKFDIYSGGGLGANPRLGLLVYEDAEPGDMCCYLKAMVDMFMECGNYENRAKARVRYMRDTLGDEGYISKFREKLDEAFADPSVPRIDPEPIVVDKKGDGSIPSDPNAKKQIQDGLYYVKYHPLGGDPEPGKMIEIRDAVRDMEQVELRTGPNETLYVINLTGKEADKVADVLSDGARTLFESSVSCVGSTICQVGLRDSHGTLLKMIEMERKNGFADGVLPMIRISGCGSSCAAHQLGVVGFKGASKIDGEPSFEISVNGSHVRGKERLGTVLGKVKESEMPTLFEDIGNAVIASGKGSFREWYNGDPERMLEVGRPYIHQ